MAKLKLKRGTTAANLAYVGIAGTLSVDTELNQLRLHDGSTPGGKVINDPARLMNNGIENYLANGDLRLWLKGTSQTTRGYLSLTNWCIHAPTSGDTGTRTFQRVADPDYPGEYIAEYNVVGGTAATDYDILAQQLEDVNQLSGKYVTLSFDARCTAGAGEIAFEFTQIYGVGGSASTNGIGVERFTLTSGFKRYSLTFFIPAITTDKTIGEKDRYHFYLWLSAGSNYSSRTGNLGPRTQTVQFRRIKVENGLVATPFVSQPPCIERVLADRYLELINEHSSGRINVGFGHFQATDGFETIYRFRTPKRSIPTVSLIAGAATDFRVVTNNTSYNVTALSFPVITREYVRITAIVSSAPLGAPGVLQSKDSVYPRIAISDEVI